MSLEIFGRFVDALDDLLDRRELARLETEDEAEDGDVEDDPKSPFVREERGAGDEGVAQVAQLSRKQLKDEQKKSDKKLAQQQVRRCVDDSIACTSVGCCVGCVCVHSYRCIRV